jgi:putative transposase
MIRTDQGPEVESFNGTFRDECLNEHWFPTLAEARDVVATWRADYNQGRPPSLAIVAARASR